MSGCSFCHLNESPDQKIILRNHTVLFLRMRRNRVPYWAQASFSSDLTS
jgi:hypothetical protein